LSGERRFYRREELVGKLVIDHQANIIGQVTDIAISPDGKMGLSVTATPEGKGGERVVFFEEISTFGDVILLNPLMDEQTG